MRLSRLAGLILIAALLLPVTALAQEDPVKVAYFYKVKWGFAQEFERLYMKNHYPIMLEEKKQGRILDIQLYRPRFHGEGRAEWNFLSVITFASWEALGEPADPEEIARELFSDLDTFRREEQRRFELIEAHWDVPLEAIPPR